MPPPLRCSRKQRNPVLGGAGTSPPTPMPHNAQENHHEDHAGLAQQPTAANPLS